MTSTKIGFIGTGVMGKSMVTHLINAGNEVYIYTRTKERANDLLSLGAVWKEKPSEIASTCDVIFTIVGYPSDVEEVYFGDNGLLNHAKAGSLFIDMTTSSPSLAKKIYEESKKRECDALDAPVSGGDVGAKNALLTIMVGGDQQVFERAKPFLSLLGKNIILQGPAGAGQHTKMCNQISIASSMIGLCEALAYAKTAGLDPNNVLASISTGAAGSWSLTNLAPRIINENFEPGFYIKHFIKDMKIAIEESEKMGLNVPGLSLAKQLYDQLVELGEEDSGTHALYKLWERR